MTNLDTTWPHLPAPAPALWPCPAWFSPAAAAFENDALASALAHASASPSSPTPSSSTTTTTTSSASELSSVHYDVPPAHAQPVTCRPVPAPRQRTGRVSKRKPRPSRRPPTTYITADPADFRRMVQEITGFNVPGAAERAYPAAAPRRPDPLAFVLPTLDTSACFMLHQASTPPQQQRWEDNTSNGAATGMAAPAAGAGADDSSLLLMHELEAMMSAPGAASGFPTLESWGII
ncbi:hypothetical protein QYE76_048391 [Lolium multiflorum]|uniref:VQ domain-containing protein n=1 Tax=Lolium multiflorum TaxID=4521 RepID=A0AAD8WF13_LOLMU|nr:hypothetical protein QYE76_048391 [Lolium multiflorum]